mmetsp:Transcript_340/g.619  ORF Transcript_340/g.619 Transcript_340/m.619 type:complete len:389 (+) Transcript_340:142-1308(+)
MMDNNNKKNGNTPSFNLNTGNNNQFFVDETDMPGFPSAFSRPQEFQPVTPSQFVDTPGSVNGPDTESFFGGSSFEEAIKQQEMEKQKKKDQEEQLKYYKGNNAQHATEDDFYSQRMPLTPMMMSQGNYNNNNFHNNIHNNNQMKRPVGLGLGLNTNHDHDNNSGSDRMEDDDEDPHMPLNAVRNNRHFDIKQKKRPASMGQMRNPFNTSQGGKSPSLSLDCSRLSLQGEGGNPNFSKKRILDDKLLENSESAKNMRKNVEMIKRTSMQQYSLGDIPSFIAEQEAYEKNNHQGPNPHPNTSPRKHSTMASIMAARRRSYQLGNRQMRNNQIESTTAEDRKKKRVSFSNRESETFEYESSRDYYKYSKFYHLSDDKPMGSTTVTVQPHQP